MSEARGPVLLGGYAAKQCPVRIQNDFHPLQQKVPWQPTPEEQARLDAGRAFEDEVFDILTDLHHDAVRIDPRLRAGEAIAETVAAMDAGAPLILGGWLPDDEEGRRTGRPDILIRSGSGYLPADVKHHMVLGTAKKTAAVVSSMQAPAERCELRGWSSATGHRFVDGLQLAHYTRMLQACGYHAGPVIGAILGTTTVELPPADGPAPVFVWHALDEPMYTTYSRSEGSKKRSILECYDHEHGFRVKVVDTVLRITGGPDDPTPLVSPVGHKDCESCPYNQWCAEQMGAEDPSFAISKGRLSRREYLALRRIGVETTADLSALDLDDPEFFDRYFAEVSNFSRKQARKRLEGAVRRAQMIVDGIDIVRDGDGPPTVPSADVEIDVDLENDRNNLVYLWGVRIREGQDDSTARYIAFVDWEPMDSHRERELARKFVDWLRSQRDAATAAGKSVLVFHWSDPEVSKLRRILGLAEVGDLIDPTDGIYVDLLKVFDANFFSLHGSSLKKAAAVFGFSWSVDDPGGSMSQLYLDKVHSGDPPDAEAARQWLLTYNEDDTCATAAVRDGMRCWSES